MLELNIALRLTMTTPNVIVFGETGAGKSSLINLTAGYAIAPISSRPIGCTFQSMRYTVDIGGMLFNLHDTAGLDEANGGTVAKHEAIVQLYTLLRRLNTGVSLLVFCMRGPRIKESGVKNWRLFLEIICQRKVPIVLVVTGLENEENGMDYWWTQNKEYFMRYQMYPNGVACIRATRGKKMTWGGYRFDEEYAESQFKMREAIRAVYLRTPWQVPTAEWFKEIIEVSWTSGKHPEEIYLAGMTTTVCRLVDGNFWTVPGSTLTFLGRSLAKTTELVKEVTGQKMAGWMHLDLFKRKMSKRLFRKESQTTTYVSLTDRTIYFSFSRQQLLSQTLTRHGGRWPARLHAFMLSPLGHVDKSEFELT